MTLEAVQVQAVAKAAEVVIRQTAKQVHQIPVAVVVVAMLE
jgi:hypothetical protein